MELNIFDKLLGLPLFQGLSRNELTEIADKVRLDFRKVAAGTLLVKQQAGFDKLFFLLNGEIDAETTGDSHTYTLSESLSGNLMFEVEPLFGLHQRYSRSYRARTDVQILCIDKPAIVSHLLNYDIVRFNLLNAISTSAQNKARLLRADRAGTLIGRFVAFLNQRVVRPAGRKTLQIKMEDLGAELGETRLTVSQMLRRLQTDGLLRSRRMLITIPAFEQLIHASKSLTYK